MSESSPTAGADAPVVDTTTTPAETAVTNSDVTTAASSTAEAKPATMLDAVKAAIAPKDATPASKSTDQPAEGEDPDSKTPEAVEPEELSADELKALSEKTQKRFSKLSKDLKATRVQVESLAPKAAEFDKIDTYVRNAGLSPQDVAGTLEIAALMKSNRPADALARLEPLVAQLRAQAGETLPAELQTRVDQGYLTEADAKTLAKAQAGERLATQRNTALTEQQQADTRNQEFRTLTTNTVSKVTSWEAQQASRDPDWHLKRDHVAKLVESEIKDKSFQLGRRWFPNAEEAIALSVAATKSVNDMAKKFAPRPQEIRPISNGGASPRSTAVPQTMLDVVRQNVGTR